MTVQTWFSMKQISFEQNNNNNNKKKVLLHRGQVLYLIPYRFFFLSSILMLPQPFSTLYIIPCSLSLHPPQNSPKTQEKEKG